MPLVTDVQRTKPVKLDAPLHVIEVQLGALVAHGVDGQVVEGKAGETVDAAPLRPPIKLTASESPCRVRIFYDSEAGIAERRGRRSAEREAARAAQGKGTAPEPARPQIH